QTDCVNLATGVETINGQPVTTTAAAPAGGAASANDRGVAKADGLLSAADNQAQGGSAGTATIGTDANPPLPAPTLANGLPGATNFVPNNVDPDRIAQRNARYFDVTLAAAGTTTLDTTVAIDNLTIASNAARLNVTSAGSLTSNLGITHTVGTVQNDGVISTGGDYLLVAGNLTGGGRINAGYFTSILGTIAPGTLGTTGTLTFGGNVILASGNTLLVDLGPSLTSDQIAVVATQFRDAARTMPIDGQANIGGRVLFGPVAGTTVRYNDLYTIVTAQGGVTGTFAAPGAISAILTPRFVYTTNAVQVAIDAGLYANVVANTPVQQAYAALLDRSRGQYAGLSGLYGPLDLQNAATIQGTLEGLAPRAETLKGAIGVAELDNMARFYRDRLSALGRGDLGGTIAVIGNPAQTLAAVASPQQAAIGGTVSTNDEAVVSPARLPSNVSAFVAGGYIDGHSRPMPTAIPLGGNDRFSGYFLAGGIEAQVAEKGFIGFSIAYSNLDGTTNVAGQTVKGELGLGTLYGKYVRPSGLAIDGQASAGQFQVRTRRGAALPGSASVLTGLDRPLALSGELGLAQEVERGTVTFGPRIAIRGTLLDFSPTVETGGPAALRIERREYNSVQGRAGLFLAGQGRFAPFASGYYVHEFEKPANSFNATFAGGPGVAPVAFALAGTTKNWGEVSGGLKLSGPRVSLSVGADTTIGRDQVENQSYRGTVTVKF
ncbi:MAG: autotransporter outer membrane beta-barrel domain-containing protein, partial [Sphingomonadaceae bacterium]|nr:autotransporter outer membrane beta-barrel domain-containing protein [Sphingomonadaceae bacterium]